MSNTAVGAIYGRVIDAVVDASRTDFEEHGVSNAVLEGLREKWQNRLSQTDRAAFPWDPESNPPPQPKVERDNSRGYSNGTPSGDGQPPIKQEFDTSFLALPARGSNAGLDNNYAAQRAAQLVHQRFGSQANGSITAIQAAQNQRAQQQQQPTSQQQSMDYQQSIYNDSPTAAQSPQGQPNSPQIKSENTSSIKLERDSQQNGFVHSQTDGAGDLPAEVETDAASAGPSKVVFSIRDMVERNAQRLEGGGLLVPLDERLPSQRRLRLGRIPEQEDQSVPETSASAAASQPSSAGKMTRYGGDMADDDDEDDEDAINSDLDDPDETADTTVEGLYEGDVILCLYDKVQRVKNKWKCVLREGILTIDGKDYVFHKANGEFEW